jgi:hypothetical protein
MTTLTNIVDNYDIINNIIKYLNFNDILKLRLLSQYYNLNFKDNKININIKYYIEFLNNRNKNYDPERNFIKIINNINVIYNYWSPYGGDLDNIKQYQIYNWNMLFSNNNFTHFTPLKYAIYYAYFILNNTATSERINLADTSYSWKAIIYDNGMIKQLTNTTGYLCYNKNEKSIQIKLIYNSNMLTNNNFIKDIDINFYTDNLYQNISNNILRVKTWTINKTYLEILLNN